MTRQEQARATWEDAVTRLEAAATAIRNAPTDATAEQRQGLEQTFDQVALEADRLELAFRREETLAEARSGLVAYRTGSVEVRSEPRTYERHAPHSFFRDLFNAGKGDVDALERIKRHSDEMRTERRDLPDGERRDLTQTSGQGGNFIAPVYLMDDWIRLARAGRPFANAVSRMPLIENTNSINVPKVSTGTATATQQDLGAVQDTDPTTSTVSVSVHTIAGQVDLSRQLFEFSYPGIDQMIFMDLAADYATKLDVQCLNGSGSGANALGVLQDPSAQSVTYTDASPSPGALYSKIANAIQLINTSRYLTPTGIVMHPRRWSWICAALDADGRPLVLPSTNAVNPLALVEAVGAENLVGNLQGIPVIIDASLPTNLGAGTNQDPIIVSRLSDNWLWEEDAPRTRVFEDVKSGTLEVRCQCYGYFAFTTQRYSQSNAVITGTGLVAPSF